MNISIGSIDVNYRVQGEGPTLLLLHGWGADLRCFNRIFRDFSPSFRVVAPDLPGFGLSGDPSGVWNVQDYADFVSAFMDRLGIEKAVVLGHSFGGRIAIKLASNPLTAGRLEKIVLAGSAGLRRRRPLGGRIRGRIYRILRGAFRLSGAATLFPGAYDRMSRKFASRDYLSASPLMRQCLVRAIGEDLAPLLTEISLPTLLIWGADDRDTPVEDGYYMRDHIHDSRLEVLTGAGHFVFLHKPEEFTNILKAFLQ